MVVVSVVRRNDCKHELHEGMNLISESTPVYLDLHGFYFRIVLLRSMQNGWVVNFFSLDYLKVETFEAMTGPNGDIFPKRLLGTELEWHWKRIGMEWNGIV